MFSRALFSEAFCFCRGRGRVGQTQRRPTRQASTIHCRMKRRLPTAKTRGIRLALLLLMVPLLSVRAAFAECFIPVDFSSQANFSWGSAIVTPPGEPAGVRLPARLLVW